MSLPDAALNIRRWREDPVTMVRELFGAEPDEWQIEALRMFPKSPRLALKACAGPGKLESVSTIIETPAGARRWGDLKPGDEVFAEDGSVTTVVGTFPQGIKPIYRVSFDDGSYARVGADHLWKVRGIIERRQFSKRQSGKWSARSEKFSLAQGCFIAPPDGYSVLTTAQIVERGVMTTNRSCPAKQFEIPSQGPAQFPASTQSLDPYVVGVWIGDGSRGIPHYTKPSVEIEREINRRGVATNRGPDGKSVRLKGVSQAFAQVECSPFGSHERFIPDAYKYASIAQRTDLLCGLMDTDGCIGDDSHMEYDTTSERLANDVVWLVRSLGGVAFIKMAIKKGWYRDEDGNKVECRDCYRVSVTLPFNPFIIPHKRERWHYPQKRYLTRYIASIELDGEEEAMCIQVAHPSCCYLTRDFIVTHNTALLAWCGWNFLLTRPHPIIGVTSITADNLKANLWTELARWREKAPLLKAAFEMTKSEIYARDHPTTWRAEVRTWAKDADPAAIGNALRGLHSKYIMWLLDESGDYPDAIMPVCENIFSGDPVEAHIIQVGNPTKLSGPLYRACTSARKLWEVIEITGDPDDPKRSKRISIEHAQEQIRQYGRDNPWVMVNILGKFPPASLNALIGPDEIEAAMQRYYRTHEIGGAPRVLGVDVAAMGDDASVMCSRQGIQVFPFMQARNIDSTQGAGWVARKWNEWNADACFVDNTGGFGAGWIDQLRALGKAPIPVGYATQAHDVARYVNKRAEMYFEAVQWIKDGGALPQCPELKAALTQTTYSFRGDKLLLEPKSDIKVKLGYSPDHADSFVQTFAEPVVAKAMAKRGHHTSEYDPFASFARDVEKSYDPFGGN